MVGPPWIDKLSASAEASNSARRAARVKSTTCLDPPRSVSGGNDNCVVSGGAVTSNRSVAVEPRSMPTFRVSAIIDALADEGIEVHRDAVVRASDKFLHLASREGRRSHRQWTAEEIDLIVTAFRLRHQTGLIWPRIAEIFQADEPVAHLIASEISQLRSELEGLSMRLAQSEQLMSDLAAGRNYVDHRVPEVSAA